MNTFTEKHAQLLYCRFCAIYGDKFIKPYHDEKFKIIWYEEWTSGLTGIDVKLIKDALEYCKINLEWAPSIAEFRRICEQSTGVPSMDEALQSAIRRDFSHPIVSIAYDKVGSWAMKNDKSTELKGKFQAAYTYALNQFRVNPDETWKLLESANAQRALPAPPSKIPSPEECKSFRERLAEYQAMAKESKAKLEAKDHPTWPKEAITRGHAQFDERIYNERKKYLMETDEYVAGTLPRDDWYDRIRFIRELEGQGSIKNENPPADIPKQEKPYHKRYNSSKVVYNNWNN